MWLQFKRANKIHVLLFVTNFHVPIIVSFNPQTTHQPGFHNQCQPGPIWGLRTHYSPRYIFNRLHWNQGRRRALGKWVERGGHIWLFMVNIVLVTDFSVLKKKMLSYKEEICEAFVCLFVCLFKLKKKKLICLSVFQATPFLCTPSFRSISKALSSPL